jgi:hypothetical protein
MRTLIPVVALLAASAAGVVHGQDAPPDTVVQAALEVASAQLDVPTDNLLVVMTAQRDWSDASLGCPEAGKAYAQVITPGWVVTVDTDDLSTELQVNTDTGSRAVIC